MGQVAEQLEIPITREAEVQWDLSTRLARAGWNFCVLACPAFAGGVMVKVDGGWGWGRELTMRGDSMEELAPELLGQIAAQFGVVV